MRKRSAIGLIAIVLAVACLASIWLYVGALRAIDGKRGAVCRHHFAWLYGALRYYHDKYGKFPPAYVADRNGKPMHSWRVLLLETMGDNESMQLYQAYRFDEPWDGPHNRQLLDKMPSYYACPNDVHGAADRNRLANYVVIVGPNTVFHSADSITIADTAGFDSDVIVIAETVPGIPWLEPRDLEFDKMSFRINDPAKQGIASKDMWGPSVVLLNGEIKRLRADSDPGLIKSMITVKPKSAQGEAEKSSRRAGP
jgi:hypothetical protein